MTDHIPADQSARDAALDPQRSVIVQAPAGSGKTGLLIQRFLVLLAGVEQPEEIVAITFTRKAAAEMRERILDAIEAAARGDETRSDEIRASANARRTRELAKAAMAVLATDRAHDWNLLDNPSRLRITTIDSFNAMLTRQMPISSGLGQQPAITEETSLLCRAAVNRLLDSLDDNDERGVALRRLLAHLDNRLDELTELLSGMLAKRDLWLRHLEFGGLDREVLEQALTREVETVLAALDAALPESVRSDVLPLAQQAARYLDASDKWSGSNEFLRDLAACDAFPSALGSDLGDWQKVALFLLTTAGELRKPRGLNISSGFPAASEKGISAEEKTARDMHKQAMAAVLAELDDAPDAVALLAKLPALPPAQYTDPQWEVLAALNTLMPYAVLALQEIFSERGEVDFAELAIRARDALGSDEAPTDLALKLDYRIRHLLVDEFQDTSHSQVDLLLRLTRGWEPGNGRSLFVVGDPMQSIYQFREAEVGHFLAVREHGLGSLPLDSLRLSANFRSQAGVVEWVNDAFRQIFPARDDIASGAIAFEPSEAACPPLSDDLPDDGEGKAVQVHAFGQYDSEAEAARVLELVRTAQADPDNRSTAILVRGRANLVAILPALRDAGIRFHAVELESLESVPVVRDLLALTRALVNPADSTALLAVLRAPWCGLRLRDLEALMVADEALFVTLQGNLPAALDATARYRLERVRQVLVDAEQQRGRVDLRERVEAAWLALGGPATLRAAEELEDARLFFELLQQLDVAGDLDDVNEFDERLKRLYAAPDPEAGESLQVMTLHKAKGLQFDTVIIPALDQVSGRKDRLLFQWIERTQPDGSDQVLLGPLKSRDDEEGGAIYRFIESLKEEKESLERARLLYVGITRAIRHVHLLGKARWSASKGAISLATPRKGSLLELLWPLPDVRDAFECLPIPQEKPQKPERSQAVTPLRRLPDDWQAPAMPTGPMLAVHEMESGGDTELLPFDWASERIRRVGTLVHRCLENIARDGIEQWPIERFDIPGLARQLEAMGLPETDSEAAAADVQRAVQAVLASERGRWILDAHAESRVEWEISGEDRGELVSVAIDRSFVDTDGTRWIVDYKTSIHEGGRLDEFLAEQQRRYRDQLERYARLVSRLDDRPVRVALYFPLQDAFHDWEPATDP